jgi:hypothetical protein
VSLALGGGAILSCGVRRGKYGRKSSMAVPIRRDCRFWPPSAEALESIDGEVFEIGTTFDERQ